MNTKRKLRKKFRCSDCGNAGKHHCKGMCRRCYMRNYVRSRRATDPSFVEAAKKSMRKHADKQGSEWRHNRALLFKYGITIDDYYDMLEAQGGCCPGCLGQTPGAYKQFFSLDHCHTSGDIRGLLCDPCNRILGQARDDAATLRRLADYLEAGGYAY